MKLSTQDIRGSFVLLGFLHDHFIRILSSYFCEQIVFAHDPKDFLMVHMHPSLSELHGHGSVSIFSFCFNREFSDEIYVFFFSISISFQELVVARQ